MDAVIKEKALKITKTVAPILISIGAIIISFYSLYVTYLEEPQIKVDVGYDIEFYQHVKGPFSLMLAINFTNLGAKLITIQRIMAVIEPPGPADGYLLEARFFERLDVDGSYGSESTAVPITVHGRKTVPKVILFHSSFKKDQNYFYLKKAGNYKITLLGWIADSSEPVIIDSFSFSISPTQFSEYDENRQEKKMIVVRTLKSGLEKWSARSLTNDDSRFLLKRGNANHYNP